jgi:aldehyde dehydrogenase (NAD+)
VSYNSTYSTMAGTYTHKFDTQSYKGSVTIHTGLFIDGKFVDPVEGGTVESVWPLMTDVAC